MENILFLNLSYYFQIIKFYEPPINKIYVWIIHYKRTIIKILTLKIYQLRELINELVHRRVTRGSNEVQGLKVFNNGWQWREKSRFNIKYVRWFDEDDKKLIKTPMDRS